MKTTFITITVLFLGLQLAQAQTGKGDKNLGFNAIYNHSSYNAYSVDPFYSITTNQTYKSTNFSAGPSFSYFVADNLDLGVNLNYSYTSNTTDFNSLADVQSTSQINAVLFVRKYILSKSRFGVRFGPYAGYTIGTQKNNFVNPNNNYDASINNYNVGANLDALYYPTHKLGLAVSLANFTYAHQRINAGARGYQNQDNFSADFITNNLSLSVFYVFGSR